MAGTFLALFGFITGGILLAGVRDRTESISFWSHFETATRVGGPGYVEAPTDARRVVALSLAGEEIILDLIGPEALAAASHFSRDPRYSNLPEKAKQVGQTVYGGSVERLIRLDPDCVFVATYTDRRARQILRRCKVPVVPLQEFNSFDRIRVAIRTIGTTLGQTPAAEALVASFDTRLEASRAAAQRAVAARGGRRVEVLYVGPDPRSPWTAGRGSIIDAILQAAGAVNVAVARADLLQEVGITREAVLQWNPEVLLIEGEPGEAAEWQRTLEADPAFAGLDAVRQGKIAVVPTRLITSTSHYAAAAVEALVDQLYPSLGASSQGEGHSGPVSSGPEASGREASVR